jgi:predicted PurR-regulated permease PerM
VSFGVGAAVLGFLLMVGALFEGPRLIDDARSAFPPQRRPGADAVGRIVYNVIARYFAGSLLIAFLNGVWVSVVALLAGVPLSPVLGVWAALTSLIPQIGGLLGFVVIVAVSLTQGVGVAIVMGVAFGAYMTFDNNVLLPVFVGRAVDVSAPVTMLGAIGGFAVAGVAGSLLAIPIIGAGKAIALSMRGELPPSQTGPELRLRERWQRLRLRLHRQGGGGQDL